MRDYFIHASFDLVEQFKLRIPKERNEFENDKVKRICVSTNLLGAVRGIPGSGYVIKRMMECNLPVIIHAYYLESEDFYYPTICDVPDQVYTNEVWMLKEPISVIRGDYRLENIQLKKMGKLQEKDFYYLIDAEFIPVPYGDNFENLSKLLNGSKLIQNEGYTFRSVIWNIGGELVDKLKERGK